MPKAGLRYPKRLLDLKLNARYSVKEIATNTDVAERSVFRWITQGYLTRVATLGGVGYYEVNATLQPELEEKREEKTKTKGKYTKEELESIYQDVIRGDRQIAIDVGRFVREKADKQTFQAMLKAFDEFREFVQFMIDKT